MMGISRAFSLHNRAEFNPADCIRCGRDTQLIDLGVEDLNGYGRVYFCVICFAELADAMDYSNATDQQAKVAALQENVKMLERTVEYNGRAVASTVSATEEELEQFRGAINNSADDLLRRLRARASEPIPVDDAPDAGGPAEPERSDGDDAANPDEALRELLGLSGISVPPAGGEGEPAGGGDAAGDGEGDLGGDEPELESAGAGEPGGLEWLAGFGGDALEDPDGDDGGAGDE